jgi:8-oxo-dGTP pyrophosphatase MutT (NUDIX family)
MDFDPVWLSLVSREQVFTLQEVRAACRRLPDPQVRPIDQFPGEPTLAATAIPVIDVDGAAALVLTQRAPMMTRNRGDWVFPGGRVDDVDASSGHAAARELSEELGVAAEAVEVLGRLDSHGPIMSGFIIDTYVVAVAEGTQFLPAPQEVSAVRTVPVEHFMADGSFSPDRPLPAFSPGYTIDGQPLASTSPTARHPAGRSLGSFAMPTGELVWGLQAAIIANLLEVLVNHRSAREW